MIVAACPIRISRKSRSRSIASALLTIYHAAERAPAPDLIVLGACREPATAATETAPASEAMCTGFRETIAGAAREWGVWIALGYTRISDGATTPAATVFDPDGDAWIRHPRLRPRLHETDSAWSLRSTSMGAWALSADAVGPGGAVTAPPDAAGLALLPVYAEAGPISLAALQTAARQASSAVCFARAEPPSADGKPRAGLAAAIVGADGAVLARLDGCDDGQAVADLEIPPADPVPPLEEAEHVE
jgi:hypothetical protein